MLQLIPRLASAARLSAMGQRASVPLLARGDNNKQGRGGARRRGGGAGGNGGANDAAPAPLTTTTSALPPTTSATPLSDADLERALGQPLSRAPMCPPPRPLVLVVSGPSGVGKDAVLQRLRARRPGLRFVVTATTRPKRPGETEGVDYHFVSREAFERWIANGELLEHALVYGEYKGIPRAQVERALSAGEDVVLRVDVQGAATVRRLLSTPPAPPGGGAGDAAGAGGAAAAGGAGQGAGAAAAGAAVGAGAAAGAGAGAGAAAAAGGAGAPSAPSSWAPTPHASVFIVAESQAALARRLAARGTEDAAALARRFREAEAECARLGEFDYVVVNREGRVEECVDALERVIDAHKARVAPVASAARP